MSCEWLTNLLNVKLIEIMKDFLCGKHVSSDRAFKVSTEYTAVILLVLMSVSMNVVIECKGDVGALNNMDINSYCANGRLFLVKKVVASSRSNVFTYGIDRYDKETDEIVKVENYMKASTMYGILMGISYAVYFFWKVRFLSNCYITEDVSCNLLFFKFQVEATRRIKPVVKMETLEEVADVFRFIQGKNVKLAVLFVGFKLACIVAVALQFIIVCGAIGSQFLTYGFDVTLAMMSNVWPKPQDVLFPKMAKCEYTYFEAGGDERSIQFLCTVRINRISEWTFCILWFWLIISFVVSIVSVLQVLISWRCTKSKDIDVSFSDFVLIRFIEMNLNHVEYVTLLCLLKERAANPCDNSSSVITDTNEGVSNQIEMSTLTVNRNSDEVYENDVETESCENNFEACE